MIFALPSSPHWAPTTTVTGMGTLPGDCGLERALTLQRCARIRWLAVAVMRIQRWERCPSRDGRRWSGAASTRSSIPTLRASIVTLLEDVRERGDDAVCDALARFDRVDVTPDQLRVTDDELDSASVSDDVDAAIDDAIAHLRAFNEQQLMRSGDWSFESEPGLTVGEKITPIASAGLFTPSGKASYPSVTYQLLVPALVAGVPRIVAVVPPVPGGERRGRPGRARRLPQARAARRLPGQRPGRHRRPRVRHRVDPGGAQGRRTRFAGGHDRPGRDAAPRRDAR